MRERERVRVFCRLVCFSYIFLYERGLVYGVVTPYASYRVPHNDIHVARMMLKVKTCNLPATYCVHQICI
jgi:hypothetical protein